MNIYQRINEVRKKVAYVKKDTKVNNQYTAVTHDAVLAAIRPALIELGIIIAPTLLREQTVQTGKATGKGNPIVRHEAVYRVDFINADEPEDRLSGEYIGHAEDEGDKAPGKALSYAVKYAELKVFTIETGDNDEPRIEAVPAMIDKEQLDNLLALADEVGADMDKFCRWLKVDSLAHLKAGDYDRAVRGLEAKRKAA